MGQGGGVPFYENVIGNFVVYQLRIETNLIQLLAHPETLVFFVDILWYYF